MKTMQRMAVFILAVMAGTNAGAIQVEKDVVAGATDLGLAAAYSPAVLPATTNDIAFLAGTTYANAASLSVSAAAISMGTLNDLNAVALTISGPVSGGTSRTITLNGGLNAVASANGGSTSDLICLANGASMTIQNLPASTKTLGVVLAASGNFDVGSGGVLTISGIVSGNYNLNKTGAGTLTLSGVNTFSGSTTINNGQLKLGGATALQNSAYDTTGSAGAIGLDVTDYATPTLGGLAGSVDLATAITGYIGVTGLTLNPQAGVTVTYGGVIADGSGAMTLTKSGTGTQILTGPNTYSGGTTNTLGTLALGADNVLSTGLLVMNGGTLGASGGARLLTNAVSLKLASKVDTTGGAITLAGAVTNNANVALTIVGTNALTLTNATLASINVGQSGTSDGHLVVSNYGFLTVSSAIVLNNSGATPSTLFISGGGAVAGSLINGLGINIGGAASASSNYVVVTGAGSVLSQASSSGGYMAVGNGAGAYGNYLIVSNGATATGTIKVGNAAATSNNYVLVDNATQSGVFNVGNAAGANGNYLIVTNGGYAGGASSISSIGGVGAGTNNYIIVAGTNSAGTRARFQAGYNQTYALEVGAFAGSTGNYLLVGAGGQYMDAQGKSLVIGYVAGANGNYVTVTNGGLIDFTGAGGIIVGYAQAATNNYLLVDGSDSLVRAPITVGNVTNANSNYVNVTGGGLLEANTIKIGNLASTNNTLTVSGGILQFSRYDPAITISNGAVVMDSGTLSYRGIKSGTLPNLTNNTGTAQTGLFTWPAGTTNAFRLNDCYATNSQAGGYTFAYNASDGKQYARLEMVNGTTELRGQPVTIGSGGTIYFDRTAATIRGGLLTLAAGATIAVGSTNGLSVTVTGGLTVGNTGTLVLPSGLAKDAEFKLIDSPGGVTGGGNLSSWTDAGGKYKLVLKNTTEVWVASKSLRGTVIQFL